jgi:hypothetical protein
VGNQTKRYTYKEPKALTAVLMLLMGILGLIITCRIGVLLAYGDATAYTGDELALTGPQTMLVIADIGYLLYFVALIPGGFWIARASENAHSFRGRMDYSVAGSVGWYFVPFLNLVKPYNAMDEIWAQTAPAGQLKTKLLPTWWALWIISNIMANIVSRVGAPAFVDAISDALTLATLACFALLVVRINRAQRITHAARIFSDVGDAEVVAQPA